MGPNEIIAILGLALAAILCFVSYELGKRLERMKFLRNSISDRIRKLNDVLCRLEVYLVDRYKNTYEDRDELKCLIVEFVSNFPGESQMKDIPNEIGDKVFHRPRTTGWDPRSNRLYEERKARAAESDQFVAEIPRQMRSEIEGLKKRYKLPDEL